MNCAILILITGCDDQRKWYYDYVGEVFVAVPDGNQFKTRDMNGHINFIDMKDARHVKDEN